jgi:6-phosphogluconolactonase
MKPVVQRFGTLEDACRAGAQVVAEAARESINSRGIFHLVLSGGKTPLKLYQMLARAPLAEAVPWRQTHLYWGDERLVSLDHADSNYAGAHNAMISHVDIPDENVHPVPVDASTPAAAAMEYERTIKEAFPGDPRFDLVLLGIGADGHTASLFPDHAALEEQNRWVLEVSSPQAIPPVPRVTFTLPVLNAARRVVFLVTGQQKARILEEILQESGTAYPAARVRPQGQLLWLVGEG